MPSPSPRRAPLALAALALCALGAPGRAADLDKDLERAAKANNAAGMVAAAEAMRDAGPSKKDVAVLLRVGSAIQHRDVYVACRDALAAAPAAAREEVVKSLTKGKAAALRVLCADALGGAGDDAAAAALADALDDKETPVRLAAIRALARLERKACVEPLFSRFAKVDPKGGGAECEELFLALQKLTGHAFEALEDWRKWWSTVPADFDPRTRPRTGGEEGTTRTREGQGKIFESVVASQAFVLILDISSSMRVIDMPPGQTHTDANGRTANYKDPGMGWPPNEESRFRRAQNEFVQFIEGLTPRTKFSLVVFGAKEHVKTWKDQLTPATEPNKKQAIEWVRGLQWSPATETDLALERAFSIPGADTFYLFSDGIPERQQGGANVDIPQDEVITKAQTLNLTRKARLHCYGFATASAQTKDFLRRLAAANDGDYKDIR